MTTNTNSANHQVSPQLIKAYRQASYVVFEKDTEIVLKVGKVSPELVSIMKNNHVNCAAFLARPQHTGQRQCRRHLNSFGFSLKT